MGGCPNYGPFLGTLDIRSRIIIGIQKGTKTLTTTHMCHSHEKNSQSTITGSSSNHNDPNDAVGLPAALPEVF